MNTSLFKNCLLRVHQNLKRKHLEVIKCICACPDQLTLGKEWKRCLRFNWEEKKRLKVRQKVSRPGSSKSAHIYHYTISASIQHGRSLRKYTQSIRLLMCRQGERGTWSWCGITNACEYLLKIIQTYWPPAPSHRGKYNHAFSCKAECKTTPEK